MSKDTVNVEISQDLVRPIIETKIQAAIHEALGQDPQRLIQAIVDSAMHTKVDSTGEVGKSSYDNKHDFLEVMVKNAIREESKAALDEVIAEHRPKIREAVKRNLMGARGAGKVATAVVEGIAESLKCKYTSNLTVSFQSPKDEM